MNNNQHISYLKKQNKNKDIAKLIPHKNILQFKILISSI